MLRLQKVLIQTFQSTPPRRRRQLSALPIIKFGSDFNPRLREGGDATTDSEYINGVVFQSTPPRRRRRAPSIQAPKDEALFQSTPPRRRRLPARLLSFYSGIFQSTPPRRRRLFICRCKDRTVYFNPRLREGGDL